MKVVGANLNETEKALILTAIYDCYYDTNQDTKVFASEFYNLTIEILKGNVPLELEFLVDFEERLVEALPRLNDIYKRRVFVVNELTILTDNDNDIYNHTHLVTRNESEAIEKFKELIEQASKDFNNAEIIIESKFKNYVQRADNCDRIEVEIEQMKLS